LYDKEAVSHRPYIKLSVNISPRLCFGLILMLEFDIRADVKTGVYRPCELNMMCNAMLVIDTLQ